MESNSQRSAVGRELERSGNEFNPGLEVFEKNAGK